MANKQEISTTQQKLTTVDILKAPSIPRDAYFEAHRQLVNIVGGTTREIHFTKKAALSFSPEISSVERDSILSTIFNSSLEISVTATGGLGDLNQLRQEALKLPADKDLVVAHSNIKIGKDKNGQVTLSGQLPGEAAIIELLDLNDKTNSSARIALFLDKLQSGASKNFPSFTHLESSFNSLPSTVIDGGDKLVELDKTKVPNQKGVTALKKAIGTGVAVLQIEDKNGELKLLNLFAEDFPKLETGAMIVHGRIVDMKIQKSLKYSSNAELAFSCAPGAFSFETSLAVDSYQPGMTASLTCTLPQVQAKGSQPVAYLPPFQGLDDPKGGMVIYHEPHRQIKDSNKVLSPDGTSSLTPEERITVESFLDGGAEIENLFGAPIGAVAKNVTVIRGTGIGPHITPIDLSSIRVQEDEMLRLGSEQAQVIGRHETIHLFDTIFQLTERADSKLNQFWQKLKQSPDKGASFFSRINESAFYMIANGGHSQDSPMELLASAGNAMLHPKKRDILARETPEFRNNFAECMQAVKADILSREIRGISIFSSAPIIKKLDDAIIAAKTSTERVRT